MTQHKVLESEQCLFISSNWRNSIECVSCVNKYFLFSSMNRVVWQRTFSFVFILLGESKCSPSHQTKTNNLFSIEHESISVAANWNSFILCSSLFFYLVVGSTGIVLRLRLPILTGCIFRRTHSQSTWGTEMPYIERGGVNFIYSTDATAKKTLIPYGIVFVKYLFLF